MPPDATWAPAFIQGGALLIVAFFVFWGLTKTIPSMATSFHDRLRQQEEAGAKVIERLVNELAQSRAVFLEEIGKERNSREDSLRRIEAAIESQTRILLLLVDIRGPMPDPLKQALGLGPAT